MHQKIVNLHLRKHDKLLATHLYLCNNYTASEQKHPTWESIYACAARSSFAFCSTSPRYCITLSFFTPSSLPSMSLSNCPSHPIFSNRDDMPIIHIQWNRNVQQNSSVYSNKLQNIGWSLSGVINNMVHHDRFNVSFIVNILIKQ